MISVDKETCGEDPSATLGMTHYILKTDKIGLKDLAAGRRQTHSSPTLRRELGPVAAFKRGGVQAGRSFAPAQDDGIYVPAMFLPSHVTLSCHPQSGYQYRRFSTSTTWPIFESTTR